MHWIQRLLGQNIRETWPRDILASLVVFLVAMPLCMGIALASGAPVAAGLVTGIIGGIVVGFLAGAPLQVSGPAAGLTVICGEIIREHGLPAMGVIVVIAGGLQLAAGLSKLGQWFRAVSPAVIHGMLSGIGVLILSSQLHVMVDDRPRENGLANLRSIPEAIWKGLPIPAWEPAERRHARIGLLQTFGRLHERQSEIDSHTARLISRHGSARQHQWEADHLAPFVPQQEQLVADLRKAAAEFRQSPVALNNGERAAQVEAAIASAIARAESALSELQAHSVENVESTQADANAALAAVLARLKSHDWAAKMGLIAIAVIFAWQALAPRRLRLIPGPLLAVAGVTGLAWFFSLPVLYVEVPDNLIEGLTFPSWNVFQDVSIYDLAVGGLMMAVIASAETLLCASAVDRMHQGPRTNYDRELAAQGVGNMLCGLVGGLPMTGVIVRSAANVQAGGRSRLSAILHGVWLLIFVVLLAGVLRMIPISALAGVLVYTGFKLIDWKGFLHLWHTSKSEAAIFLVTLVVIVVEDLLLGVVTGIVLSAVKLLVTFSYLDVQLQVEEGDGPHRQARMNIAGAATFLRLPVLAARLDEVPKGAHLHVDFERLDYIDHACLELLINWEKQHESAGGRLVIDWGQLHARFREVRRKLPAHALDDSETPVAANGQSA
jgi:MFS superfamily sulfate permease-like transporter